MEFIVELEDRHPVRLCRSFRDWDEGRGKDGGVYEARMSWKVNLRKARGVEKNGKWRLEDAGIETHRGGLI